jgi:mono/diheme cytochrome c family protein
MKKLTKTLMVILFVSLITACQPKAAVTEASAAPSVSDGETVFNKSCASCHSLEPDKVFAGPSLAGIGTRAADTVPGMSAQDYIRESIVNPGAYIPAGFENRMPGSFGNRLNSEEIDSLVAYLMTLK